LEARRKYLPYSCQKGNKVPSGSLQRTERRIAEPDNSREPVQLSSEGQKIPQARQ